MAVSDASVCLMAFSYASTDTTIFLKPTDYGESGLRKRKKGLRDIMNTGL